MILEPGQREFHRLSPPSSVGMSSAAKPKWRSQRRSDSKKGRRSGAPYFSMAKRSMPPPKAKPWYFVRIDAAHLQHARMDHAGAGELQPVIAGAELDLAPPERSQRISHSTDGSVKGKKLGRARSSTASTSKNALQNPPSPISDGPDG